MRKEMKWIRILICVLLLDVEEADELIEISDLVQMERIIDVQLLKLRSN